MYFETLRDFVPGVYCTDLFSEQISAEQGQPSAEQVFTNLYQDDDLSRWICPNITMELGSGKLSYYSYLRSQVLPCDNNADLDLYAGTEECDPNLTMEALYVTVKTVSSNFDPTTYHESG